MAKYNHWWCNLNIKDRIIKEFKERIDSGKSIKYNDFREEDPTLLNAIEKYMGGIFRVAKEVGLTEDDLVNKYGMTRNINSRTLSEQEILDRLLYLKSRGRLTTSAMRTDFGDFRLETSIKKLYGNVENGLEHFNLKRDTTRHSKASLSKRIRELSDNGEDMSYTSMMDLDPTLVHNSTNHFKKGWHRILDELNIPYEARRQRFSKESIKDRLYKLLDKYGEISFPIIRKYDSSILFYAYDNYDSIIDFYIDMGIDPNECMDFSKQTIKGFEFERAFKEVLELMHINFRYNKNYNNNLRPDFQLNKGVWIDCKLSSWTESIEDTINKYTPHCKKLIIVFLRGDERHLDHIDYENVEFRKVDYYYPFLKQINRQDLIGKFESIVNNDFLESVTTERLIS